MQDAAPANATPSDAEAGPKDKSHELTPGEKQIVEPKETKKMTIGQKIKHEIQHYWDGTKLLATEVRISTKLAMKMAAGYELSRRESRQVSWMISVMPTSIANKAYHVSSGEQSKTLRG